MATSDLVAEEALLGTILESPNKAAQLIEAHRPDDFALGVNAAVFQAICSAHAAGKRPDKITVHAELGGSVDLDRLEAMRAKHDRLSWQQYSRIVKEHAASRAVLDACADATALIGKRPPSDVVEALSERLTAIATRRDERLVSLGEVLPAVMDELEKRRTGQVNTQGLKSGVIGIDEMTTGYKPGQLIVIAGDTGSGKTSYAMQTVFFSARHQDASWLVFNLEMTRGELTERAVAHNAKKDSQCLRTGAISVTSMAEMRSTAQELAKLPIYLEDQVFDIGDIQAKARAWRARHPTKPGGVLVDYLQLASAPDKSEKRQEEVASVARALKRLAKSLGVPVVLLSQLNREGKKAERAPSKHDLRDSGTIEDDADLIILGHRIDPPGDMGAESVRVDLIVDKQRGGPTGKIPVRFIGRYFMFEDAPPEMDGF